MSPPGVAALQRVAAALPDTELSGDRLREHLGFTPRQLRVYTHYLGFAAVPVATGPTLEGLLLDAARRALRDTDPATVRYVLYAHTAQQVAPLGVNLPDRLRRAIGLRGATALSLAQQNCASGLYALRLAATLLAGEPETAHALVVTGEQGFTESVRYIPGIALVGDAAAAAVVGRAGGDRLLAARFRTLGRFYRGTGLDPADAREYQRIYQPVFCEVIQTAIAAAGLALGEVAMLVPNNVNRLSWTALAKALGYPIERIYLDNLPRIGHLQCSDPFVNLGALRRIGGLRPGDHYVLAAVGQGATFGAVVLRAA